MIYDKGMMIHGWKMPMAEKLPLPGGMTGMCGHGCMMQMITMMLPMLTLNTNARA